MSYREKTCPTCGTKHKKRGPYCSRSCGNKRKWTPEQKDVFRQKKSEYLLSDKDEAEVERWQVTKGAKDEYQPVAPMVDTTDLNNNQFIEDGDLWTADDDY